MMRRIVQPELLDSLPAEDPGAIQSRADLRRVNWWMGHARWMSRQLRDAFGDFGESAPQSLVELGAGDGTLLLRLAEKLAPKWKHVRVVLVDQHRLLSNETQARFDNLGWSVTAVQQDVFEWLGRPDPEPCDVCLANLFLHHFEDGRLRHLLAMAARQTRLFLACEPRRAPFTLASTRLLPLLGCNSISVHDGRASVRAGFAAQELSALWPAAGRASSASDPQAGAGWRLTEKAVRPFSHGFVAQRIGEQTKPRTGALSETASSPSN